MKSTTVRYLVFIIGLYFLSLGIVFIVRSTLGTTPISSLNYVLSLNTPITLGMATFLINMLLILGQFWLIRGFGSMKDKAEILLQIPFSFIFSAFIDFNMHLSAAMTPANYLWSLAFLALGCMCQSLGIVLELKPNVAIMSAEGFVKYASRRYGREFGRLKVMFDVSLVSLAILTSLAFSGRIEGVREGSVIAALCTGYLVTGITAVLSRLRTLAAHR